MRAIATPIGACFSRTDMKGAWYHEYHESNKSPHSFHRYDGDGNCMLNSSTTLDKMPDLHDFYLSDRKGNKIEATAIDD